MKYSNKWVVVPYSKLVNKTNDKNKILLDKSLSAEDKLAAYNYLIKKQSNQKKIKNDFDRSNEQEIIKDKINEEDEYSET
ncbi:unnamed protein product [Brachionus calyciflorus]|uniref:Uncharacterized protein n=1 Tax=Brachionus calyciflorus TaxID=104777 RepID=A0A814L754_9BILA|nr:unnamed protein product [Brachionus calyciflorus]